MTLHPAYEVLRRHGIRFVANAPDGTFMSNCKACGKLNSNFVYYDDDSVGWHCHDCGDSKIVPLRAKPGGAQTGGYGASVPFMLTAAHKVELCALGYSDEQILHITPQEGQDIIAQKRKASASASAPADGGNVSTPQNADERRKLEEARKEFTDDDNETETETEIESGPPEPPPPEPEPEPKPKPKPKRATIAEAARDYHERRKWKPVPIDRKDKKAIGTGWQNRDYNPNQFKDSKRNVGIQLGKVSGGLTDVDLDCMEAIALAPRFLPPTDAIFGRTSKPASHRLYVTDLCEAVVGARIAYAEHVGGKATMLVELRVGGKRRRKRKDKGENEDGIEGEGEYEYTGATTVVPPSIHASGETVTWVCDGEPAKVAGDALSAVVRKLAVAVLLRRHYPGAGSRHDGALAIGGALVHAGWDVDDIGHVVEEAARAAGDDEVDDRVSTAKGAVGANANGTNVAGLPKAREVWGDIVADTLGHWLKMRALRPDKGVGIEDRVALDFAAKQADDLRYIAETNKWMHWDAACWREEKTLASYDIARKLCRAAGDARARTVAGSISLARADRRLVATTEQWDTDAMLLQSTGMTIDLRTGTAFSPLRSNYMTKRTVCDLAPPGTAHPRWSDFLRVVTEADETLIAFLKRLSGYCLTGLTREHKFGFFHGPGGNGKGVYLNALKAVMGEYAIAAPMEMFLLSKFERHPTEIAQLKGIRLVIAQEPQKGRRWDETKLKTLTSSDPLRGRFMRQDLFGFDPTHKLMLAANYKPSLYAVNEAIRRRLMLILFRAVIANPDPEFGEKLVPEYPAILRWMVDGCVEWQRNGLAVPASVLAASEQYFSNEDDIEQWLDDCVDRSDRRAFTTTRVLYTSRKIWCEARGLSPGTEKAFSEELADNKGFEWKKTEHGRGFVGLKLYANDLGGGGGGGGKPASDDGDDEPPPLMPCSYCGRTDGIVYQMNDIRLFNPRNPPRNPPSVNLHEACTQQFFAQPRLQTLGPEPDHACEQCHVNDGKVLLIRNNFGSDVSAKPLHEQCAPFFFKLR